MSKLFSLSLIAGMAILGFFALRIVPTKAARQGAHGIVKAGSTTALADESRLAVGEAPDGKTRMPDKRGASTDANHPISSESPHVRENATRKVTKFYARYLERANLPPATEALVLQLLIEQVFAVGSTADNARDYDTMIAELLTPEQHKEFIAYEDEIRSEAGIKIALAGLSRAGNEPVSAEHREGIAAVITATNAEIGPLWRAIRNPVAGVVVSDSERGELAQESIRRFEANLDKLGVSLTQAQRDWLKQSNREKFLKKVPGGSAEDTPAISRDNTSFYEQSRKHRH